MELEEKAEEQCKKDFCTRCLSFGRCDKNIALCSKATNYCKSLLIEELQKENEQLKKDNEICEEIIIGEQQEVNELKKHRDKLLKNSVVDLQKIDELKAQIENMKRCGNCKHYIYDYGDRYCKYDATREKDCKNRNEWELAE